MSTKKSYLPTLLSLLLVINIVFPFSGYLKEVHAEPIPYTPLPDASPAYSGMLSWVDYGDSSTSTHIPYSLTLDSEDNQYVVKASMILAEGQGIVEKISSDGLTVTDITYNANLTYPIGITADRHDNLYVLNNTKSSGHQNEVSVWKLAANSDTWVDITGDGTGESFYFGLRIAVNSVGDIYVTDGNTLSYQAYATKLLKLPSGSSSWQSVNMPPMTESFLFGLDVDGADNLYVSKVSNNVQGAIYKLPFGASSWEDLTPPEGVASPYGLTVDKFDNLYVSLLNSNRILKLGYGGSNQDWSQIQLDSVSASIIDLAADSQGYLYGANMIARKVSALRATLTYTGNGHTSGTLPLDNQSYRAGQSATIAANEGQLQKTGHSFVGWSTDASQTEATYVPGQIISVTQSMLLHAVWQPIPSYTVSYLSGPGGSITGGSSEQINQGASPVSVPTAVADVGYVFLGWSRDGGTTRLTAEQVAAAMITKNETYTAYFEAIPVLSSLKLDRVSLSLNPADTHQTVVSAVYSDQTQRQLSTGVVFTSNKPAVAKVSESGLITAVAEGEAVVTAKYAGLEAQVSVMVQALPVEEPNPNTPAYYAPFIPSVASDKAFDIFVDGVKQEKLAVIRFEQENGREVAHVVLDNDKLIKKVQSENYRLVSIPVEGEQEVVVAELSGRLLQTLEQHQAGIELTTAHGTFTLSAEQIGYQRLIEAFGADADPDRIRIQIRLAKADDARTQQIDEAIKDNGFVRVSDPVDFEVTATYGEQALAIDRFDSYVTRTLTVADPDGQQIVHTGVVFGEEGAFHHIPTVITVENDTLRATLNSLSNSTYLLIANPTLFNDTTGHWAHDDAVDMFSRLVVQGDDRLKFRPQDAMSRAEYVALVMRALGIHQAWDVETFNDVASNAWYEAPISAATAYGLVTGYEDGTFRPERTISRMEAIAILVRAAAIADLEAPMTEADADAQLAGYADEAYIPTWARQQVAAAVQLELLFGREGALDLSDVLTRAEATALVRRMLQTSELINP